MSRATLITDRVGAHLTKIDKVLKMQNHVAEDFWDLARKIGRNEVDVQYRFVFVYIGLDWCLTAKRFNIKEGLKRLLYAVEKSTAG